MELLLFPPSRAVWLEKTTATVLYGQIPNPHLIYVVRPVIVFLYVDSSTLHFITHLADIIYYFIFFINSLLIYSIVLLFTLHNHEISVENKKKEYERKERRII